MKRSLESSRTYVTAEFKSEDLPLEVIVGEGNKLGGYENKKLSGGHTYRLFLRAYARHESTYVNTSSSLTQPITLPQPNTSPLLPTTFGPKTDQQSGARTATKSGNSGAIIAIGVIAPLILLAIAAVIVFVIR